MAIIASQSPEAGEVGMSVTKSKIKNTRPTLSSLPIELLNHIGSLLDRNSLISLKSVSRTLAPLDDLPLWHSLSLSLPPYYGASPYIHPLRSSNSSHHAPWAGAKLCAYWEEEEGTRTTARYQTKLRQKLLGMIKRAGDREWETVRSVTMTPTTDTIRLMVLILEYCYANLSTLTINAEPYVYCFHYGLRRSAEVCDFDIRHLPPSLSFPSLTHLRLTGFPSANGAFVLLLCEKAANLVGLDIDFVQRPAEKQEEDERRPWGWIGDRDWDETVYTPARPTKLRQVRFSWDEEGKRNDLPAVVLFIGILRSSPEVEQVVLAFKNEFLTDQTTDEVLGVLDDSETLRDLRWPIESIEVSLRGSTIRRLVLGSYVWDETLRHLGPMGHLEELILDGHPPASPKAYERTGYPDPYPCKSTFPYIAASLRHDTPLLRLIGNRPRSSDKEDIDLFNRLDAPAEPASQGYMSSMRHGDQEVMQLRFLRYFVEVADRACAKESAQPQSGHIITRYESRDERGATVIREKVVKRLDEPEWWRLTNYGPRHGSWGMEVPTEILEKMREVEGDGVVNWERRGVEVKADTWAVLSDWYRDQQGKEGWDEDEME